METRSQWEPHERASKKRRTMARTIFIILLIVALICGAVLVALKIVEDRKEQERQAIIYSDQFHQGIVVGGVDVGGLTYAKAQELLAAKEEEELGDIGFQLVCNGSSYAADSAYFTVTSNADEQLKVAFTQVRSGSLEALQAELEDISVNGRSYDVTYSVTPKQAEFEALIQSISGKIDQAPTAASFSVKQLPIDESTGGVACYDIGLSDTSVDSDGRPITDLRDLRFDFVEGKNGYGVEHDALYTEIVRRTGSREWGEIDVPLGDIPPEITVATLKEQLVLRTDNVTKYSGSSSRIFNIKKASGKVYGTVLQPGDVYSHNTVLGDRTEEGGWMLAPAVIDGGANHEDQAGGGVCQTSTTLYQAVLKSDLQVVTRRGHSIMSSYAPGGLDCTVADSKTGNIDFQFSNNTNSPIYIFMWLNTKNKRCHVEIYGEPFSDEFDEIQLSSELIETIAPTADVYTQNPLLTAPYWQLRNAAKEGYSYDAYKSYMKDGAEVKKVLIDNTVYKMHPARYYVWPGWIGEPLDPLYKLPYEKDE